jgi:hypothetical protein
VASCRPVWFALPDRRWVRSRRQGTGQAPRAGHGQAEMRHALAPSLSPLRTSSPVAPVRAQGRAPGPLSDAPPMAPRPGQWCRSRTTAPPPPSPPGWRVAHTGAPVSSRAADRMTRPARRDAGGPWWAEVASGAAWHGLCLLCLHPLPSLEPRWCTRPTGAPGQRSVAHGLSEESQHQEEVSCAHASGRRPEPETLSEDD